MTGTKTSSRKRAGFTLLELLAVVAIISILVMISVPVYHNVQEDAEKKVLEYNTRVLADVLSRYLEEERENGIVSRAVLREIMATAVGDPDNPLSGRIDGTSLDETWITYINVGSQSENYGGFTLEWNGYEADGRGAAGENGNRRRRRHFLLFWSRSGRRGSARSGR